MFSTSKQVYCLEGESGFLCDTEWDGDTFTSSPLHACQWDEPPTMYKYECVSIIIHRIRYPMHNISKPIPVTCKGKIRYKCKCSQCGQSTKNMSTPELATERGQALARTPCVIQSWERR